MKKSKYMKRSKYDMSDIDIINEAYDETSNALEDTNTIVVPFGYKEAYNFIINACLKMGGKALRYTSDGRPIVYINDKSVKEVVYELQNMLDDDENEFNQWKFSKDSHGALWTDETDADVRFYSV